MKARNLLFVMLLLVSGGALPARFDNETQVRKAVQSALDRFVAAWKKLDVKTASKVFNEITTADFVGTDVATGAIFSKPQILYTYGERIQKIRKVLLYDAKIESVKVTGDKAKVKLGYHLKTKVPEKGRLDHTMEIWQTSESTWVKTKSGWKMKASATKLVKGFMDGEPIKTGAATKGG